MKRLFAAFSLFVTLLFCFSARSDYMTSPGNPSLVPVNLFGAVADGRLVPDISVSGTTATSGFASCTVTITIASPAIVTNKVAAGTCPTVVNDTPIVFATTGALPTGLTAGTTYYVSRANTTDSSFSVAATVGGTAINTTGTQSGTQSMSGPGWAAFSAADVGKSIYLSHGASTAYVLNAASIATQNVPGYFNATGYVGGAAGSGYQVGDTITLNVPGAGGTCATSPVVTVTDTALASVAINTAGSGYPISSTQTLTLTGTQWYELPLIQVTVNGSGVPTAVSILRSGKANASIGTLTNLATAYFGTAGTGSGLTLNITIGVYGANTVTTAGSCASPPTSQPVAQSATSGSGTGATFIAYMNLPGFLTTIKSVTSASQVVLNAAPAVNYSTPDVAAIYTDNLARIQAAFNFSNATGQCVYFPGATRFYGMNGRINLNDAGKWCATGDGAAIPANAIPIFTQTQGSWIFAGTTDRIFFIRGLNPAANNYGVAQFSKLGTLRANPITLVDGVYTPNQQFLCDFYDEGNIDLQDIVTYNATCGLHVRGSSTAYVRDWSGECMQYCLFGERNGDIATVDRTRFNLFYANATQNLNYVLSAQLQNARVFQLGGATVDSVSAFALGYRCLFCVTYNVGGSAACSLLIRATQPFHDENTALIFVDQTANGTNCSTSTTVRNHVEITSVDGNGWVGPTDTLHLNHATSYGSQVEVYGQHWDIKVNGYLARSNDDNIKLTGTDNIVSVGPLYNQGWNYCAGQPYGCLDQATTHYGFFVSGANVLDINTVPGYSSAVTNKSLISNLATVNATTTSATIP